MQSEINWGTPFAPNFGSIGLPTYGNYGGPGYTGGQYGGRIDVPPKNALDALFQTHDINYEQAQNRLHIIAADLILVIGINELLARDSHGLARADIAYAVLARELFERKAFVRVQTHNQ